MKAIIRWKTLKPGDHDWHADRGLYAYLLPDETDVLYLGKCDGCTVAERWRAKPELWDFANRTLRVGEHIPLYGQIVLEAGGRLTRELLADIESLLIIGLDPLGNVQSTRSRVTRQGLEVRFQGWWPLPQFGFVDEAPHVLVFVRGERIKLRTPTSSRVLFIRAEVEDQEELPSVLID